MLSLINPLNKKTLFLFNLGISSITYASSVHVPECPKTITVKGGKVIDSIDWSYSFDNNFIDEKSKKVIMEDGILTTDYKFPEISQINTFTNTVTGGLSYDLIEETNTFLSLTWNIKNIYETSEAVFVCDFHGDQKIERPVRLIYVYKKVPRDTKECTVSYNLINHERIPESQKLVCTK